MGGIVGAVVASLVVLGVYVVAMGEARKERRDMCSVANRFAAGTVSEAQYTYYSRRAEGKLNTITLAGGVGLAVVWVVVWWLVRAWVASRAARTAERRYVQRQMRTANKVKKNIIRKS